MNILYFADIRFPLERANGIQTMATCHALAARGHQVRLVVRPDTRRPVRDPLGFYGLPRVDRLTIVRATVVGPPAARRAMYLAQAVGRAIRVRRRSLALTRDLGVAGALARLPRTWRPPVVYESHGFAPLVAEALPELLGRPASARASTRKAARLVHRERRVWHAADGYVTITRGLADELTSRFGPRLRLAIVPDGVRLDPDRRFAPPPAHGRPVIAYAGHLYPWKGVDTLLHALVRLPSVAGLVVGGHPQEPDLPRLRALAADLGIAARVTFTGLIEPESVAAHLASADLLVLPNTASAISVRYTSPLKLFEYMAAGRPIVASDLPALRELLRDGENAVLVTPGDPDALALGIGRILADPELARRLGRTAFEEAREYSWERRAARLESLMASVFGERPPPASSDESGAAS